MCKTITVKTVGRVVHVQTIIVKTVGTVVTMNVKTRESGTCAIYHCEDCRESVTCLNYVNVMNVKTVGRVSIVIESKQIYDQFNLDVWPKLICGDWVCKGTHWVCKGTNWVCKGTN